MALLAEGNAQQASVELNDVLAQNPAHAGARQLLAQVRLQLDNPDGALRMLGPALANQPGDTQVNALIEAARSKLGAQQSVVLLEEMLEQDPQNRGLASQLASAYLQAGAAGQGGGAAAQGRRKRRRRPARGLAVERHRRERRRGRRAPRNRVDARRESEESVPRQPRGGAVRAHGRLRCGASRAQRRAGAWRRAVEPAARARPARMDRRRSQGGERGDRPAARDAAVERGSAHGRRRNCHGRRRRRLRAHALRGGARRAPEFHRRAHAACAARAAQWRDEKGRRAAGRGHCARAQTGGSAQRRRSSQSERGPHRPGDRAFSRRHRNRSEKRLELVQHGARAACAGPEARRTHLAQPRHRIAAGLAAGAERARIQRDRLR